MFAAFVPVGKLAGIGGKVVAGLFKRAQKFFGKGPNGVNPNDIKFSQPTVSQNFSSNGTINATADGLRNGSIKAGDIPAIRVVEQNGDLITLDNRRLLAFQQAGVDIPVQRVSLSDPAIQREFLNKFNPVNNGRNVVVTQNAAGQGAAKSVLRSFGKIK